MSSWISPAQGLARGQIRTSALPPASDLGETSKEVNRGLEGGLKRHASSAARHLSLCRAPEAPKRTAALPTASAPCKTVEVSKETDQAPKPQKFPLSEDLLCAQRQKAPSDGGRSRLRGNKSPRRRRRTPSVPPAQEKPGYLAPDWRQNLHLAASSKCTRAIARQLCFRASDLCTTKASKEVARNCTTLPAASAPRVTRTPALLPSI